MQGFPSDELLARFLADEVNPEERRLVEDWAHARPAHAELLAKLAQGWREGGSAVASLDVDRAWAKVSRQLGETAVVSLASRRTMWQTPMVRAAAAVVLIATAAGLWLARESPVETTIATAEGEERQVVLKDGTTVVLEGGSSLTVRAGYSASNRTVSLLGGAKFVVVHDAGHPFHVEAGRVVIEDLGTTFLVRMIAQDSLVRVALLEGAASVRAGNEVVTLKPGDLTVVRGDHSPLTALPLPDPTFTAWHRGSLVYTDATVDQIHTDLTRWYNIVVALPESFAGRRVSATLPTNDLREAIEILALSLSAKATRVGDTVTFR